MNKYEALKIIRESGLVAEKISLADYEELKNLRRRSLKGAERIDYDDVKSVIARKLGINLDSVILISNKEGDGGVYYFPGVYFDEGMSFAILYSEPGYGRGGKTILASKDFNNGKEYVSAMKKFVNSESFTETVIDYAESVGIKPTREELEKAREIVLSRIPESYKIDELNSRLDRFYRGYNNRESKFNDRLSSLMKNVDPAVGDEVKSHKLPDDDWWKVADVDGDEWMCKNGRKRVMIKKSDVEDVKSNNFKRTLDHDLYSSGVNGASRFNHANLYKGRYVEEE
jgi:hypothetical protein